MQYKNRQHVVHNRDVVEKKLNASEEHFPSMDLNSNFHNTQITATDLIQPEE